MSALIMLTEDLVEFSSKMHDVARSMRAKLTDADVASYFAVCKGESLRKLLERLSEWQTRPGRRFFPTAAQLLTDDPESVEDAPKGEAFTPQWWIDVRGVEKRIVEQQRARRGAVTLKPEPEAVVAAEREVSAAARGLALHEGRAEATQWDRRYQRACLQRDRIRNLRRAAVLEALPPPSDEWVHAARTAWITMLREYADRAQATLVEFYSDDDPFGDEP